MKRQPKKQPARVHKPPANLRSRDAQDKQIAARQEELADEARPGSVEDNVGGEMQDEAARVNASFNDSAEPPPPQLRRTRATTDPRRSPADRNTGIKHRDRWGVKHRPAQSKHDQ